MNIIEYILSQQADIPLLAAFILGILVAINPCQLAINMSALTYLIRQAHYRHPLRIIMLYTLGKTISYTALGWVMMCLIGGGRNIDGIRNMLSKAEIVVPYILIALGFFMIYRAVRPHHHHNGDNCHHSGQMIHRNGPLGAIILGVTLAFAFCPESAVFYFGLMLPLSITSSAGAMIPLIFALAASIPLILMALIIKKTLSEIENISHIIGHAQQLINGGIGILFIVMAVIMLLA